MSVGLSRSIFHEVLVMKPYFQRMIVLLSVLICLGATISPAGAIGLSIVPPSSLIIDGMSISQGIFTLAGVTGIDRALNQTIVLDPNDATDDEVRNVTIGSALPVVLLPDSDGASFPLVQSNYTFDATAPDKPAINANVLSAAPNQFTISLPLSSAMTGFWEIIDSGSTASFFSGAPTLSLGAPTGNVNVDLFGDSSIFANFSTGTTQLSVTNFQSHGRITVVPVPAAMWLFGSGLIGLLSIAKHKKS